MHLFLKNRSYNFSPGPAMLPSEVIQQAHEDFFDFYCGMSAMEISHRESRFVDLLSNLNNNLIKLLNIPNNYKILWTTGGATLQFSLVPLNLIGADDFVKTENRNITADYLCTGHWSNKAASAAARYVNINKVIDNSIDVDDHSYYTIADPSIWQFSKNPLYLYYTPNETLTGLQFSSASEKYLHMVSKSNDIPIVADMTSCILSKPIDVSNFGIIYASAQKNMGFSGLTLVIIRDDLLKSAPNLPEVCSYKLLAAHNSILNTPPTFNIYITDLVISWLLKQGGLDVIYNKNLKKSEKLYNYIDSTNFYINKIKPEYRSLMNVTFNIASETSNYSSKLDLENEFLAQARDHMLFNLAGHRFIGGMRASMYNAMPEAGVDCLIAFMKQFVDEVK